MPINHTPIEKDKTEIAMAKEKITQKPNTSHYLINPNYSFKDIILTKGILNEIKTFISLVQNRDLIFKTWGLETVIKKNNCNINLYGESGTGKTMTAHAIADKLRKQLLIVNYSEIESKFVGETSKNLVNLFDFAKDSGAVVLFDEADALLSKRVSVMHSATDVSVNQTRNVLLKILDEYSGVVIFTTNFIQNFDVAFMRRIFTHVKFDLPDEEARKLLWNHYLVNSLPVDNRDMLINTVSKYENMSGSDISSAVLKAAINASNNSNKIINVDLVETIIKDIQKSKVAVNGGFDITTRKVSEDYALNRISGGCNNGNNK